MADAERQRLLPLARQTYTAGSDVLQAGQDENRFRLGQIGLLGQVGEDKRGLAQKEKDFDYSEFIRTQGDPNQLLRDYANFITRAPLRTTQYSQEPSTFQELMGLGQLGAAVYTGMPAKSGGSIANLAMGDTPKSSFSLARLKESLFGKKEDDEPEGPPTKRQAELDAIKKGKELAEKEAEEKEEEKLTFVNPDLSSLETRIYGRPGMYSGEKGVYQKDGGQVVEAQRGGILGSLFSYPSNSQYTKLEKDYSELEKQAKADNVITAEEQKALDASPFKQLRRIDAAIARREPAADLQEEDDAGFITKIIRGAGKGLRYYTDNIDPFQGLTPEQRLQTGLSILAESPGLGESPITTTARGALKGVTAINEQELARAKLEASKAKANKLDLIPSSAVNTLKGYIYENLHGYKYDSDRGIYMKGNKPLKGEVAVQLGQLAEKGIRRLEQLAVLDPSNAFSRTVEYVNKISPTIVIGTK